MGAFIEHGPSADTSRQVADETLRKLGRLRAASDFELCQWFLCGFRLKVHELYGFASFREYAERWFGCSGRGTEERVRVAERLEELDAETPVLFDETEGIDFEAVADTAPDVILASYSGLTQEEYDTLSKIAPVVAYPEVAWGTTYQDMILMNSEALGLAEEGEELVEELDRLSLPFTEDGTPSEGELRIAQAQLVGWLEGLFHGIQTALFAQQMAARAQLEHMRQGQLPPGMMTGNGPAGPSTGQYL